MISKTTSVQSLIFDNRFFEAADAVDWAVDHGFRADKIDETDNAYRLRQASPSLFSESSFRTISLRPGVQAVIAKRIRSNPAAAGDVPGTTKILDEGMEWAIETARLDPSDEEARRAIVERYGKYVQGLAYKMVVRKSLGPSKKQTAHAEGHPHADAIATQLAQEARQIVFQRLLAGGPRSAPVVTKFEGDSTFATFIGGITRHVVADLLWRRMKEDLSARAAAGDFEALALLEQKFGGRAAAKAKRTAAAEDEGFVDEEGLSFADVREIRKTLAQRGFDDDQIDEYLALVEGTQLTAEELLSAQPLTKKEARQAARELQRESAQEEAIDAALSTMSPQNADVLRRRRAGESYAKIADDLGVSVNNVSQRLFRARKELERLTGIPLEGLVGEVKQEMGLSKRGRPRGSRVRQNPWVENETGEFIYFEDAEDLIDLYEAGTLDGESLSAGIEALHVLGRL
ncbi:MAG: sigma-70 family RNA polymerase sigma factor [Betaproteobacteria bacterium]|nr:sigma-70 family RNA polymerase sigma factor [Betaproteobacteria bacterium]NCA16491.1 sigma-70 family RNA polymerase sigma factor [Betaproteobacteria bacterium]